MPKLGHALSERYIYKPGTCTIPAESGRICANCKEIFEVRIGSVSHDFDTNGNGAVTEADRVMISAGDCDNPSQSAYECQTCGHTEGVKIGSFGHDYDQNGDGKKTTKDRVLIQKGACGKDSISGYVCTVCGHKDGIKVVENPHQFDQNGDGQVTGADRVTLSAANCTQGATTAYQCTNCSALSDQQTGIELGHRHVMTTVHPTETAGGYDLYECQDCDDSYKDNHKDPTGGGQTGGGDTGGGQTGGGDTGGGQTGTGTATTLQAEATGVLGASDEIGETRNDLIIDRAGNFYPCQAGMEITPNGRKVFRVIAEPDSDGSYSARYLLVTPALLETLYAEGVREIWFEMEDVCLRVPVALLRTKVAKQLLGDTAGEEGQAAFALLLAPSPSGQRVGTHGNAYQTGLFVKQGTQMVDVAKRLSGFRLWPKQ